MIKNTFSILHGIGEKLEKRLWHRGILDWDDFLAADSVDFISAGRKIFFDANLKDALKNLNEKNADFFTKILNTREHWRLFQAFRDEAVALDIETNGYTPYAGGYVTVVGLYDGFDYMCFLRGKGLSRQRLEQELSGYKYLITFFGSVFDLPFLRDSLGITFQGPHFDLCFGGRRVGLKGGLKKVEEILGISRDESVKGFDGFDAVKLWADAKKGNTEALELLITYNRCDTVNLFEIADTLYGMLRAQTGIAAFSG